MKTQTTEQRINEILNAPISSYSIGNLGRALYGEYNRFSVEEAIEEFKKRDRAEQEVIVMGFDLRIFKNQEEINERVKLLKSLYNKW